MHHQTRDELIGALLEGAYESPLWETFLDGLRRATDADYANMCFYPPGRRVDEMLHLLSGEKCSKLRQMYLDYRNAPIMHETLLEGRPYSLKELLRFDGGSQMTFYRELVRPKGVTAVRQIRVREATGVNAWLSLARRGRDFSRRDTALLKSIAPILRGVLRRYIATERERFAAALTAEAVRRLHFGWLTLDRSGRVLDCDEGAAHALSTSEVLERDAQQRLVVRPEKLEHKVFQALNRVADNPQSRPRAIILRRDPWLDMLLIPARRTAYSCANAVPDVVAYVHGDSWRTADRCEQLAELFALSPREAKLALALCRGRTIAEAACDFSLTIHSARSYSKSIYAKTGARGMPDLVRIVMRSVLVVGPSIDSAEA